MIKGFKDFVLRGNVVDLAVAVVVATAFTAIVTSFTESVVNPVLAAVGGPDAIGLGFHLRPGNDATFVDLGAIITAIITFLIVAAVVYFLIVVPVNRLMALRKRGEEPEPAAPPEDVLLLQEIRDLLRERTDRV
ncbi:MAG: large conductance mechanosensitive channel protein MscL [Actinomycetes bacterium]